MAVEITDAPESVKLDRANIVGVRPAYDGKQIAGYASVANNTTIVYTVPADHVLMLFKVSTFVFYGAVLVLAGYARIYPVGGGNWYTPMMSRAGNINTHRSSQESFVPPMELRATGHIDIFSANVNITTSLSFFGILMEV